MPSAFFLKVVESEPFQGLVPLVIFANAAIILVASFAGPETQRVFDNLDLGFVLCFTLEIGAKILAYRGAFFRDPWNVFDLLVTLPAWIPGANFLSVARVARIIRALRMISGLTSFRNLTTAMLYSLRDAVGVLGVIILIMFIFGAFAYEFFGAAAPDKFGNIGLAMFTLFRVFALSEVMDVIAALPSQPALAYPFFLFFYVLLSFIILNFFVAVAVVYLAGWVRNQRVAREQAAAPADNGSEPEPTTARLLAEIAHIKTMIAASASPAPSLPPADAAGADTEAALLEIAALSEEVKRLADHSVGPAANGRALHRIGDAITRMNEIATRSGFHR